MSNDLPYEYTFHCDLGRYELRERLNETSPWVWLGGDSDYEGSYSRSSPVYGVKLKIIGETPPEYIIRIDLNEALVEGMTLEQLHQIILGDLLPSIGAQHVTEVPLA